MPVAPEPKYDAFISYRRQEPDLSLARTLLRQLEAHEYTVAIDTRDFAANLPFLDEMERCARESRFTIAVVSPRYLESEFCLDELRMRKIFDRRRMEHSIIRLDTEPCEMPAWLGLLSGIDCADPDPLEPWFDKLLRTLGDPLPPHTTAGERTDPLASFPYRRNPFFTGRDALLERLHDGFTRSPIAGLTQARAISGLGGVGKTQTAIEYCYRYAGDYDILLWAPADTEVSLDGAHAETARRFGLAGQTPEEIRDAVKRWLAGTDRYLLVLDNADDPPLLDRYLPAAPRGHILITSRAHDFARLGMAHPEDVPVLPPAEAVAFLLHRAGRPAPDAAERDAAESLAGEVGYLPLALEQAAAYLAAKGASFRDYLAAYRRRPLAQLEAAAPEVGPPHAGVAKTWSINFQQVERESKAAADLLRLSAFLAPEAIPHEILVEGAPYLGKPLSAALAGAKEAPLLLDELLAIPARYSLIQRDLQAGAYEMHRVLQEVVRAGMRDPDRRRWAERAVAAVNAAFPDPEFSNWPFCERILPHALICAGHIERRGLAPEPASRLLNQAGVYLYGQARYAAAEPLFRRALGILEQALGPAHPDTATSLNNLAGLLDDQGQYAEAEPLYRRALEIRGKSLGPEHPDTAQSLNNLALLLDNQGEYAEAEPLFRRALEIWEKALGSAHPETATSLNNLALPLYRQGKHAEAESLHRRALEIREKALGSAHPDTAQSLNNLAELLRRQGDYTGAEPLYRRALGIREKTLGPAHPDTAGSLNNLAALLDDQGQYAEAEPLYRRALVIREKALGPAHPDTAGSLNNLALLLDNQGKHAEAEPLFRRALEIWEKALGSAHPNTATSLNNLALPLYRQGKYAEAEPLFRRALEIWEDALGPAHPDTATACANLAGLLRQMGRNDEAAQMAARAGEIRAAHARANATSAEHPG